MATPRVDVHLMGAQVVTLTATRVAAVAQIGAPTIHAVNGGGQLVNTFMGTSASGDNQEDWDAWRCYNTGAVNATLGQGAKIIALTDNFAVDGGAAAANQLDSYLLGFYGKTGAPSLHTTIFVHWANGNEQPAHMTGVNTLGFANTYELMEAVVNKYDNASLWFDATINTLRDGRAQSALALRATSGRRVGDMLADSGGLAGSYYPQKRGDYPHMTLASYVASNTTPPEVVDPFITVANVYGIKRMAIWEIGMPAAIDPPPPGPAPSWANSGSILNNKNRRRDFLQDFIFYWFRTCLANGMTPEVACYWDNQSQGSTAGSQPKGSTSNTNTDGSYPPDNRWLNDAFNNPVPNSAQMWRTAPADFTG